MSRPPTAPEVSHQLTFLVACPLPPPPTRQELVPGLYEAVPTPRYQVPSKGGGGEAFISFFFIFKKGVAKGTLGLRFKGPVVCLEAGSSIKQAGSNAIWC